MWGFFMKIPHIPCVLIYLTTKSFIYLFIFELVMDIWMLVKPLKPLLTARKPRQKPACPNTNTQL
jgi:hypothetical protein